MAADRMYRRGLLAAAIAALLLPASVQAQTFYGAATNTGTDGINGWGSASLTLELPSISGGLGQLTISPPLAGSGTSRTWVWADTIVMLSLSQTGDSILWVAHTDSRAIANSEWMAVYQDSIAESWHPYTGTYAVLGGTAARQRGSWVMAIPGGLVPPSGPRPLGLRELSLDVKNAFPPPAPAQPAPVKPVEDKTGAAIAVAGIIFALIGIALITKDDREDIRSTPGNSAAGTYRVKCPMCKERLVTSAARVDVARGFILVFRHANRKIVGCNQCVSSTLWRELGLNALLGWWCFPWGIATPAFLLSNLFYLVATPNKRLLATLLRDAGIDPDSVRQDATGMTGEQRQLLRLAKAILVAAVRADGQADDQEWIAAARIYSSISGDTIDVDAAKAELRSWAGRVESPESVPSDFALLMVEAALDVVLSDGKLAQSELMFLRDLAQRLGLGAAAADLALERRMGRSQGENRQSRRSRAADDVQRAATILGVDVSSSYEEARAAWRSAIMTHHPDRHGGSQARRAAAESRAKEINWAHDVMKRHAAAMA